MNGQNLNTENIINEDGDSRQVEVLVTPLTNLGLKSRIPITRIWAMPSKWTFTIKPIRNLIYKYVKEPSNWVDPFAGENSPAGITNDLNPGRHTKYHLDALEFLQQQTFAEGVLYDPPYSFTQAKECYDSYGKELFVDHDKKPTMMDYWSSCKNEITRIVKPCGIVISFGWNTNGMGIRRGFEIVEILIVPHGGDKNDTIVTVERKLAGLFDPKQDGVTALPIKCNGHFNNKQIGDTK